MQFTAHSKLSNIYLISGLKMDCRCINRPNISCPLFWPDMIVCLLSLSQRIVAYMFIQKHCYWFSPEAIFVLKIVSKILCKTSRCCSTVEKSQMSHLMTKQTQWHVRPANTQISLGIHTVWSDSLLCAQWVAKDPSFLHADSEDSDQTWRMPRLIWVFAGRTFILLVLSWGGSYCLQSVNGKARVCMFPSLPISWLFWLLRLHLFQSRIELNWAGRLWFWQSYVYII